MTPTKRSTRSRRNSASAACRSRAFATAPTRSISSTATATGGRSSIAPRSWSTPPSGRRAISAEFTGKRRTRRRKPTVTQPSLVNPELLSHGTLVCNDIPATRRFLTEFLGIDVVRPLPEAQYLWKGGPWSVVCVCVEGEHKEQGPQNRFKLAVASAAEVDAAHAAAETHKDAYGIRRVETIEERN